MNTYAEGDPMIGLDWYVQAVCRACDAEDYPPEVIDPEYQREGEPVTAVFTVDGIPPGAPAGRELCLVWTETAGWSAEIGRTDDGAPVPVAYLGGDVLPDPDTVAQFVDDLVTGRRPLEENPVAPTLRGADDRDDLDQRLSGYCVYTS